MIPVTDDLIRADETLEPLQRGGFRIMQKKNGFRYGTDAVLLADFANVSANAVVADFGTGSGILPLLMLARNRGERFYAFDIQQSAVDLAKRNMALNGVEDRVKVYCARAEDAPEIMNHRADAVVCNPPYRLGDRSYEDPARFQEKGGLLGWYRAAFRILRGRGAFFLVYAADGFAMQLSLLRQAGLEPKQLRFVHHDLAHKASIALVRCVKQAKPGVAVMPPLILRDPQGNETPELRRIYGMED